MEGKCQETTVDLFYIYEVSTVLGKVWNGIDAERRQESIDRLKTKVLDLRLKGKVRTQDANIMFDTLDRAEELSSREMPKHSLLRKGSLMGTDLSQMQNFLKDNALELAIHAIADCECHKEIQSQ